MRTVGVGIVGYGTVGQATAEIITANAEEIRKRSGVSLRVTSVCRRSPLSSEAVPGTVRVTDEWREVVQADDVDILVETIGGTDVAYRAVRACLERGKPVVTANKNLVARHGDEIFALAAKKNLPIGFEATVAGGVPILSAIAEETAGDRLLAVYGILNGTVNYILTRMESENLDFGAALAAAQQAGYAEADPALDIDGIDARDKLCILARLAFGGRLAPEAISVTGVRQVEAEDIHYARRLEGTIRLVAAAEKTEQGVELSVRPWLVDRRSMLAKVEGVNNAVFLVGEKIGTQMFYGRGAGGDATGAAVVADIVDIARSLAAGTLAARKVPGFLDQHDLRISQTPTPVGWYLRLTVLDRPGILARVAEVIAREGINVEAVIQERSPKDRRSFVITVEPVSEPVMRRALAEIDRFDFMLEPVLPMRVEQSLVKNA
ncbi:MAG: homoserine dehydrogenase [Acidobacteriia bacterium]|nr:homoserine dehydrogenase [Terriglobia bacterium]